MKILGIESSSLVASAAILTDEQITAEYTVNFKRTHSQTLLPMIDEIVKMTEMDLNELDAIAVSGGPGSFTGLRIGSATGKGLGLALNKPLIHVSTIEAMAYQCFSSEYLLCPIMDARRNQVYTGVYIFSGEKFSCLMSPNAMDIYELLGKIDEWDREPLFIGDGIPPYHDIILKSVKKTCHFAPPFMNRQRGAVVAVLGGFYYKQGRVEHAREHLPDYLRKSQAEREREQKMHENS